MRKNETNRLKQIAALRLLGVSNEQIELLTGESEATVRRYNDRLCGKLCSEDRSKQQRIKRLLWQAKQQVKGVRFGAKKSPQSIKNKLNQILSTSSDKHASFIWFGNIHKSPTRYEHSDDGLIHRFIYPMPPRWGTTDHKKTHYRLENIGLSLSLMGLSHDEIDNFAVQLAGSPTPEKLEVYDYAELEDEQDRTHDLLVIPPRLPVNRTQKDKKRLIQFALKHLERCNSNFIYAEQFNRLPPIDSAINEDGETDTWWVYGPQDILDWFECHEIVGEK